MLPAGVTIDATNAAQLDGYHWKLVMAGANASGPTFTCQVTTP